MVSFSNYQGKSNITKTYYSGKVQLTEFQQCVRLLTCYTSQTHPLQQTNAIRLPIYRCRKAAVEHIPQVDAGDWRKYRSLDVIPELLCNLTRLPLTQDGKLTHTTRLNHDSTSS